MNSGVEEVSPPCLQTHNHTNYLDYSPYVTSVMLRALGNDPPEEKLIGRKIFALVMNSNRLRVGFRYVHRLPLLRRMEHGSGW